MSHLYKYRYYFLLPNYSLSGGPFEAFHINLHLESMTGLTLPALSFLLLDRLFQKLLSSSGTVSTGSYPVALNLYCLFIECINKERMYKHTYITGHSL